jgi:hypothetical protein
MRERIEDLGRLAVLLSNLLDHPLISDETIRPRRPKDYDEWFASLTDDQKDDVLRSWAYGIENIRDKIYDMLSIAEGTDQLNELTDKQTSQQG